MNKKITVAGFLALGLAAAAFAWTNNWYWTNDVGAIPTYSNSPILRSKQITAGPYTGRYRVEVVYASSSANWNPQIKIEVVSASTGNVVWADYFSAQPYNQSAWVERDLPAGNYFVNIRGVASQTGQGASPTRVIAGPTYYYWQ